jgi:TrmH family RNA methyltransferase
MFTELTNEDKEKQLRRLADGKCWFAGKASGIIVKLQSIIKNTRSNPEQLVLAEGIWAAKLAVKHGVELRSLILCAIDITSEAAWETAKELIIAAHEVHLVSDSTFKKVAELGSSAGILALVKMPQRGLDSLDPGIHEAIVVLDGLEIPGNIGTIIRSCDGTDTDAIIICNRRTRLSHPKMLRSSQGACFSVPIVEAEADDTMAWLKDHGYRIILTDTRADKFYFAQDYSGKIAIVMGSERYGISKAWYSLGGDSVKIPMYGDCDSLNVGIAATIILYEAAIQRKGLTGGQSPRPGGILPE